MITSVFADGGVVQSNPSPCGTWAWCAIDADGKRLACENGIYCPGKPVSNNTAEFIALCKALAALPEGWSGAVYSDSSNALGRLFWGRMITGLPQNWIRRGHELVQRLGKVEAVLLKGHPSKADLAVGHRGGVPVSEHQVWCHRAAKEAGQRWLAGRDAA